jgi:hypothetical protein
MPKSPIAKQKLGCHRFWADRDGLAAAAQTLCNTLRATFAAPRIPRITIGQDFCKAA